MLTSERVGCLRGWCGDVSVALNAILQAFGDWKLLLELGVFVNLEHFDGLLLRSLLIRQKGLIPHDRLRGGAILSD
jgi:hypothetical protein